MFCKKCGREISGNDPFCPGCGAKQVTTYQEIFDRNGMSEKAFIQQINEWFRNNPMAGNFSCEFDLDTSIGLLVNKYKMNRFILHYEMLPSENRNHYVLVKEENLTMVVQNSKEYMQRWKQEHPEVTVVNWSGGTHSRGQTSSLILGGFGAVNKLNMYILYKYPRNK